MTSTLSGVNLVLVGDNFPIASLAARDFTFRGRSFAEKLRVGPLFQASSRNVEIQAFPERFQVAIDAPDDLDILAQGIAEVVETFLEFVGRRTITAVGHNAQLKVSTPVLNRVVAAMVRVEDAGDVLGVAATPTANVTFKTKVGNEDALGMTLAADPTPGADGGLFDFNFNYDMRLATGGDALSQAVAQFRQSMNHAEKLSSAVLERYGQGVAQ